MTPLFVGLILRQISFSCVYAILARQLFSKNMSKLPPWTTCLHTRFVVYRQFVLVNRYLRPRSIVSLRVTPCLVASQSWWSSHLWFPYKAPSPMMIS